MNRAERFRLAATPSDRPLGRNLLLALSALSILLAAGLVRILPSVALILAFPGLLYFLRLFYEKALLVAAALGGIRGVVVTSDSPLWEKRIESHWLPHLSPSFVVLNWSRRHQSRFRPRLAWRLHKLLVGSYREYCPVVIVLRGTSHPALFRFYRAFKESAQGRPEALVALEDQLFASVPNATRLLRRVCS